MKIFKLMIMLIVIIPLSSCFSGGYVLGALMPSKTKFLLEMNDNNSDPRLYVMKSIPNTDLRLGCNGAPTEYNPLNRQYVLYGGHCYMKDETYIPETIIVEYAPWLTTTERDRKFPYEYKTPQAEKNRQRQLEQDAIAAIPASEWHKIVLHPAELARKLKSINPLGQTSNRCCKTIIYKIKLNKNGTYIVEEGQRWDYAISDSPNPWA